VRKKGKAIGSEEQKNEDGGWRESGESRADEGDPSEYPI
jgi:hypothetical protein